MGYSFANCSGWFFLPSSIVCLSSECLCVCVFFMLFILYVITFRLHCFISFFVSFSNKIYIGLVKNSFHYCFNKGLQTEALCIFLNLSLSQLLLIFTSCISLVTCEIRSLGCIRIFHINVTCLCQQLCWVNHSCSQQLPLNKYAEELWHLPAPVTSQVSNLSCGTFMVFRVSFLRKLSHKVSDSWSWREMQGTLKFGDLVVFSVQGE